MKDDPERLLTSEDVAEMLRVTVNALAQMRYRRGGPPYIRLGRTVRYRLSDVTAFLDDATVDPDSADQEHR